MNAPPRRSIVMVLAAALAVVTLGACAGPDAVVLAVSPEELTTPPPTLPAESRPAPPAPRPAPAPPTTQLGTVPADLGALTPPPSAPPVGISVDGASIAGPVVPVGALASTGELAVPPVADLVGWYRYGPSPGGQGSAVLAGHVDFNGQLGVFFRLSSVAPGAVVRIGYAGGGQRAFVVVERRLVPKPQLPLSDVFARTGAPTLVLITCGGQFNHATHHYLSNVVVVAVPVPTR